MKTIIFVVILVVLFFIFKKKIHEFVLSLVKKAKGVDQEKTGPSHTVFPIKGIVGYLDITLQIEETGEGTLIVTPIKPRKKSVKLEE